MKRQKCEPLEITPPHKPQPSLWFVILISLVFAWPLGTYGKDEEGKKLESRVRCWWIRAQKRRVPSSLSNSPSVMLSGLVRGVSLCGLQSCISAPAPVGWPWNFYIWFCPAHSFYSPAFGRGCSCSLAYAAVAPFTLSVPRGFCTPQSRGASTLSQPRLRKDDLKD